MPRLSILAAVVLSACSSGPNRSVSSAPTCAGDRTVIVTNRSNKDADVLAIRRSDAASIALGTVMPGRSEEFNLPKEATWARTVQPRENNPPLRGSVDLRYGCRQ